MGIGLTEIILIIVVLIVLAVAARLLGSNRGKVRQNSDKAAGSQGGSVGKSADGTRDFIKKLGIVLLLAGVIFLSVGVGLLRWAFQSYGWAFLVIIAGIGLLYLSRKR